MKVNYSTLGENLLGELLGVIKSAKSSRFDHQKATTTLKAVSSIRSGFALTVNAAKYERKPLPLKVQQFVGTHKLKERKVLSLIRKRKAA